MLGWVGAVLGYSTIWAVSRQVGLPTWWLGPRSDPQPLAITAIPFALPVLMLIGVALGLRRIALYGVIAAVLSAPIALVDLEAQPGLAIAQIAVSLAALCASAAALLAGSRR